MSPSRGHIKHDYYTESIFPPIQDSEEFKINKNKMYKHLKYVTSEDLNTVKVSNTTTLLNDKYLDICFVNYHVVLQMYGQKKCTLRRFLRMKIFDYSFHKF